MFFSTLILMILLKSFQEKKHENITCKLNKYFNKVYYLTALFHF